MIAKIFKDTFDHSIPFGKIRRLSLTHTNKSEILGEKSVISEKSDRDDIADFFKILKYPIFPKIFLKNLADLDFFLLKKKEKNSKKNSN